MRSDVIVIALVVVVTGSAAAAGATPTRHAQAEEGPTQIDSCVTIDEPGRYSLTRDIVNTSEESCIEIRTSDVVFTGNGHTIDRAAKSGDFFSVIGVAVNGSATLSNVTVQDVTVTDWVQGVRVRNVSGGTVSGVTASNNSNVGIAAVDTTDVTVANSTAVGNTGGIVVASTFGTALSRDNAVVDNALRDNGFGGILLTETRDNLVANNTIVGNPGGGIALFSAEYNRLVDNTIANTTGGDEFFVDLSASAVFLSDSRHNRIVGTEARNNRFWAYYSQFESSQNVVENFTLDSTTVSFVGEDVAIAAEDDPPSPPRGYRSTGNYLNVTATVDGAGVRNDSDVLFPSEDSYLRLRVSYDESDISGVDEGTARIWRFDDGWSRVGGTNGVNVEQNVVFANVTDFGADRPAVIRVPDLIRETFVIAPLGEAEAANTTASDRAESGDVDREAD